MKILAHILTFISGVFATLILESLGISIYESVSKRHILNKRKTRQNQLVSPIMKEWLIKYYVDVGQGKFLYKASIGETCAECVNGFGQLEVIIYALSS